jgi:hypothetical protein
MNSLSSLGHPIIKATRAYMLASRAPSLPVVMTGRAISVRENLRRVVRVTSYR